MRTLRTAFRRHPRWVDTGLVVLLMLVEGAGSMSAGAGVLAWVVYVAVHAPLVWRRRAPVLVFWAVYVVVVLSASVGGILATGIFPEAALVVAIYTVARHCSRRHLWPAVAAIEVPAAVALLIDGPKWTSLGFITSVLAAAVLLGITASTRRAYLDQLEERARRLEFERDQQTRLAAAAERARIARDMHDVVAHNLVVMVALADAAAITVGADPERAAGVMTQVSETGRQALGEVRRLLGVLHDTDDTDESAGRSPQPGLDDLDTLVEQVRATGLPVALTRTGVPGAWGPGAGLTVYRIVQEALTNTLKHAGPDATTTVRLDFRANGVDLEIVDDGAARPVARSDGRGLAGMTERAAAYGGGVEAGPAAGGRGWRVSARLRFEGGSAM
ncbi:sensor histidine kinase [Micromonospora endolithica]|uniref:histidine kinase n=1 Tax=Micromonospora endolithica TaxID=230091 RepID=A0A3A9ZQP8_9ACTN|nr:histidine kinase [Micromonospora endolithica]RKN50264.1 sensor histidine kinase [Micromonospora endolithica]TWJ21089.1 signal transduction histidine kinase [Micromonospora endolithica]